MNIMRYGGGPYMARTRGPWAWDPSSYFVIISFYFLPPEWKILPSRIGKIVFIIIIVCYIKNYTSILIQDYTVHSQINFFFFLKPHSQINLLPTIPIRYLSFRPYLIYLSWFVFSAF